MIMNMNNNNDDDDDEDVLTKLFTCEDYREISYEIKGINEITKGEVTFNQKVLASTMSCTDHDLTGQVVWPASILLSTFLLCHEDILFKSNHKNVVLELGAGAGLASYLCASKVINCSDVIVTDGNDIVLRLLEKTKDNYNYEKVEITKLVWGIKAEIQKLNKVPNIIIGADVLLWPNYTRSLLLTIKWLMIASYKNNKNNIPMTYISYIVRANNTTTLLFQSASELKLQIEQMPLTFLEPMPPCLQSIEKMMLKITLMNLDNIDESSDDDIKEEENVKNLGFASAPC